MAAPWLIRNAVLTGDPFAPLFNSWFPNPWFHLASERILSRNLRTYGGVTLWSTPWELAIGGRTQGIFGPVLLLFPLGLIALGRRAGRLCWLAAAVLALPWFFNIGTRFLMPAFPFLALAFAMVLPRPAAIACILLQAAACWPAAVNSYSNTWRLDGFPLAAALRLEPERDFLARNSYEYLVANLINENTPAGQRVFTLIGAGRVYVRRETLEHWHSALADRLTDMLLVGGFYRKDPFYDWGAGWPLQPLRALRFRLPAAHAGEWCIHDVRLYSGADRVYGSPAWLLSAWPNLWEIGRAFDDNLATRWRTWEPMRPGMFVEVEFDRPQLLSSAALLSHTPIYRVPLEFYGQSPDGRWRLLSGHPRAVERHGDDLRLPATRAIRRAGFHYILVPTGEGGYGPLGKLMVAEAPQWGLRDVAAAGDVHLLRIP